VNSTASILSWIRKYIAKLVLILSPVLYVLGWNMVIRYRLHSIIQIPFRMLASGGVQEWAKVQVGAHPEAVVWRMRYIPVYWSEIGSLIPIHNLFILVYLFYIATSIFKLGRVGKLGITRRLSFLDFNFVKKFWLIFGILAFLTTSLSTVVILADLLALIYYVAYLISLPMVPISLYLWGSRDRKSGKN
jgi:hypothetical protein